MNHVTAASLLMLACALIAAGLLRLAAWSRAQRLRRLEADYRAFVMLAQARYDLLRAVELERAVATLEREWAHA